MLMQISNRKYQYFEIDDDDYYLVLKYIWRISNTGYIITSTKGKKVLLHRYLLSLEVGDGKIVDHKDGNPLNNHRDNLRLCTPSQNNKNSRKQSNNTSGFKGVSKHRDVWLAQIRVDDRFKYLGCYKDKIEAAKSYDKAAYELFKEYAKLNFDENSENYFSKDTTSSFNFYKCEKPIKTSKFYGVSFHKQSKKWRARVVKYIGVFKAEDEAALAVDKYIIENNLDKSKLNFK